jgi:uncharacterized membrane protein
LWGVGEVVLVNAMFLFGLILALVGLAASNLAIVPAKTPEDEGGVVQKQTSRRSSSIRLFWVLFAAMIFWNLFLGFSLGLIAVASVPVAIWIISEIRKMKTRERSEESRPADKTDWAAELCLVRGSNTGFLDYQRRRLC